MSDGPYESWIKNLRLAWMGTKAKRIMGGFAAVLGDAALSWGRQANLEHLPEKAGDPNASLPLLGSERQIRVGPAESNSSFATRLTKSIDQQRLRGSPLGLLVQLWFQGYQGIVYVQQNGRAIYLNSTPDLNDLANTAKVVDACPTLIAPFTSHVNPSATPIPTGTPWWTFDGDIEFCSRFALLVPDPSAFGWSSVVNPPTTGTDPTLEEVTLIRNVVKEWRPAKATFMGVYVLIGGTGRFFDWPVVTFSAITGTWTANTGTVVHFPAEP